MNRYLVPLLLAIPLYICIPGVSFSQGSAATAPAVRPNGPPPDNAKTRMWLLENMVKYLKLDDAAAKRFQPIFLEYSEKRGKLMRESFEVTHKISDAVDNDLYPIAELQTLAQRYKAIYRSMWREKEVFLKRSEEILDPRQMVKLTIYEDKMKEELFKRLRKDHPNMHGKPNVTPPGQPK